MNLSMEIPTAYLKHFSPLCEVDFALAHRVLEDYEYAAFYYSREPGRPLILDNSMHELGRPLSPPELVEAARRCSATWVVCPDRLGQPQYNFDQYKQMCRLFPTDALAVAMSGRDPAERAAYLSNVRQAGLLCMPYREPRWEWFQENAQFIQRTWTRLHLFGVSEIDELVKWRPAASWIRLSVDTAKPLKWGIERKRLSDLPSLRGAPLKADSFLDTRNLDCAQMEACLWNIAYLRTMM